ncbi:unnamed protein product, partial [Prorocentrum cordatum]
PAPPPKGARLGGGPLPGRGVAAARVLSRRGAPPEARAARAGMPISRAYTPFVLNASSGAEEDEAEETCFRRHSRALKCAGCCCVALACAPFVIIAIWLVAGLIAGSPGDPQYKHPFEGMAPLRSISLAELDAEVPLIVGASPLPEQLRGIFWLTDQGKSSALISFGGPNADRVTDGGKNCSSGRLDSDKKLCIRVSGDRVWSLRSRLLAFVYAVNDIRYIFTFDSSVNPTYATIQNFCDFGGWLPGYNLFFFSKLFDMTLLHSHPEFTDSVVWRRGSVMAWGNSTYEAVQVVDENGKRIEKAWSAFMQYQMDLGGDEFIFRAYGE